MFNMQTTQQQNRPMTNWQLQSKCYFLPKNDEEIVYNKNYLCIIIICVLFIMYY